MATIVYAMLTSLDGYIAGPSGDIDLPIPEEELHQHFNDEMWRTTIALCGRRMYEAMRFWDSPEREIAAEEVERDFAHAWRETPKIVFSTTLEEVGPNARLVRNDVEAVVKSLKGEATGDISVSGAELAAHLARAGLIDEYRLYLHPVVLGGGKPYFQSGLSLALKPLGAERLAQGVTLLRYAPADS
ncbi:dihydrofolate reductase family protein [Mesorhizobium sp.]|uniref:dihydrofolate reductase family protein n=1 Tax=Mesorhizobium sp. TaxID=1871066 RepID=UPI000FE3FDB9|nr:dihydrofolate reductase family protein [Mesorhizobium sp.]RWH69796.1 MAG: dihydrofolate reductase [Mesorhizobium sp.]RWL28387.1 MAG: dihydrofolate reductase [Mesorhizobium sp.]RWL29765.1 MAG: dihydrofolate reductase [Mesorhizobium sp.]RWL38245.1 MAG: dihydrofolate reductase [Mesorhizobium sp.]RWL52324.1 MAG: dihydrofolate reductase [Mesorhizobium sp.]